MEKHLKTAEFFAKLLDDQFQVFGVKFGMTALLDVMPEVGDILAAGLSFYLVWLAVQLGLPKVKILKMIWNIAINFFLGSIPVVGELTYVFRKANMKNLSILKEYTESQQIISGEILHSAKPLPA